jgi:hypothetical protein
MFTPIDSPPLPRSSTKAKPKPTDEHSSGIAYKLSSNASESNLLGGWTAVSTERNVGDIFDILPQQAITVNYKSVKSRRDSFEYQLPAKSSSRAEGESSTDYSSGGTDRRKRRSFGGEKIEYSTEKLPTVAQLKNMKSFSGIDASSPLAPLTKLKSIRSLTELAGGALSPRQGYADDIQKERKHRGGSSSARESANQDSLDKSGVQDYGLEIQIIQERKQTIKERPGPSLKTLQGCQPGSSTGFTLKMFMKPNGPVRDTMSVRIDCMR